MKYFAAVKQKKIKRLKMFDLFLFWADYDVREGNQIFTF